MKRIQFSFGLALLLAVTPLAFGADIDDLKAAAEKYSQAFMKLDAATIAAMTLPGAVIYDSDDAFPTVLPTNPAQLASLMKTSMEGIEFIQIVPYNPQEKVIGTTGITWGHLTMYIKPKGSPSVITVHARMTSTWIKSDGKWLMTMRHLSNLPQSD